MMTGGMGPLGGGMARFGGGAHPGAYDEYLTAYSMAMLPGQERDNVSYGGKIILPPASLAKLSDLEIEGPWMFKLRNPNPNVRPKNTLPVDVDKEEGSSTRRAPTMRESHAGVLEFIAEPGHVHLPAWMMKSLALSEGDKVRVTGVMLPKGKLVKIQPQTVDFLEISDPKAVLEQALRNFSTLTPGDIIEFKYNCLTFEVLIMEVKPDAAAISIVDTDLEVDFAAPKGYVEPKPVEKPPPATMASKLNIDASKTESIPPSGAQTPITAGGGAGGAGSGSGSRRESSGSLPAHPFRGAGVTLSGRKSKGKKEKAIEPLDPFSMVRRTDQPRIVTNDTQLTEKKIPAALNLDFGRLFFGYEYIPPGGKPETNKENGGGKQVGTSERDNALLYARTDHLSLLLPTIQISFSGSGQTLSGRPPRRRPQEAAPAPATAPAASAPAAEGEEAAPAGTVAFSGTGQTLGSRNAVKRSRESRGKAGNATKRQSPHYRGEDPIEIDSD